MSLHLQREIGKLKKAILAQGAGVEERLQSALRAIQTRDAKLAQSAVAVDPEMEANAAEIEEECLHTLALHQPVAFDLRFIVGVLKINGDLQRINGLATNVGEQAGFLIREAPLKEMPLDLAGMGAQVRLMLKQSLDAMVNIDPDLAQRVRDADDLVDQVHRDTYLKAEQGIRTQVDYVKQYMYMVTVSRNLERIADHTVNIADDVIYMARGDFPRRNPSLIEEAV